MYSEYALIYMNMSNYAYMSVAFRIYLSMAETECPLNRPELLICANKTKYGGISLEYAWICLKYNFKDTVKLL